MKSLLEIESFPATHREVLRQQFGVTSAEAFFEHGTRNAQGVQKALKVDADELTKLLKLVEGYLATEFVESCRKPVVKRSRGVIVDE